jgi:hypothetical protein
MKLESTNRIQILLAALAVAALVVAPQPAVADNVTERPIMEFVSAQGTFDIGFLVVPPVPNFFGWSDPASSLGLSVDSAGLADSTCGRVAGTTFAGTVKERALADGRAEVAVELYTMNAITWVVDGFDFGNGPVIFGVRWSEDGNGDCVLDGTPALGSSLMKVKFINPQPGAPLPDLVQLVIAPLPGQELRALSIHSEAIGTLADGTPARAKANEVAKVKNGALQFAVEKVIIEPLP